MAENRLHGIHVHARRQHDGAGGVAEIVETAVRITDFLQLGEQSVKRIGKCVRVERVPDLVGEDETAFYE